MTGCEPSVFCCLRACFTGGKQGLFEAGMQGYITMRSWELWAVCTEAQQDVRDKDTGLSPWRETWNFSKCWGQNKAEKQDLTFFFPSSNTVSSSDDSRPVPADRLSSNQDEENELAVHCRSSVLLVFGYVYLLQPQRAPSKQSAEFPVITFNS